MSAADQLIDIKILDRSYQIKCPGDEAAQLQESAKYLNDQMSRLHQSGATKNTERLAVVAALNICNELMMLKRQKNATIDTMNDQIKSLQQRIQQFLGSKESMTV